MTANTPQGATHVLPGPYDTKHIYMKYGYHFTGPESGRQFYRWYTWHKENWYPDPSFCNRHNTLVKI